MNTVRPAEETWVEQSTEQRTRRWHTPTVAYFLLTAVHTNAVRRNACMYDCYCNALWHWPLSSMSK